MLPLTEKENKSQDKQKLCKSKCNSDIKIYRKVRDHDHYTGKYRDAAHLICNLKYKSTNQIPVVLHNGSNCDYHLIIKELDEESGRYFECLGKNKKYITFPVPKER